jgi:hypothetical protein
VSRARATSFAPIPLMYLHRMIETNKDWFSYISENLYHCSCLSPTDIAGHCKLGQRIVHTNTHYPVIITVEAVILCFRELSRPLLFRSGSSRPDPSSTFCMTVHGRLIGRPTIDCLMFLVIGNRNDRKRGKII